MVANSHDNLPLSAIVIEKLMDRGWSEIINGIIRNYIALKAVSASNRLLLVAKKGGGGGGGGSAADRGNVCCRAVMDK